MKKPRKALLTGALSLLLCFSMLLGTTFAWFTDSVTSSNNIIKSGNLDIKLEYWNGTKWVDVKDKSDILTNTLYEPGVTEIAYLRVANAGSLALKYQLGINIVSETEGTRVNKETGKDESFKLSDYIQFGVVEGVNGETGAYAKDTEGRAAAVAAVTDAKKISAGYTKSSSMSAGADPLYLALVVYMPTTVGNEANHKTGTTPPQIDLGINVYATQMEAEMDSFGSDYDADAEWPKIKFVGGSATAEVTPDADNKVAEAVTLAGGQVSATVPAGVLLADGVTELTLTTLEKDSSDSNVTVRDDENLLALDVHIEGVSENNTTPITVDLGKVLPVGLNIGNYTLYHVEKEDTKVMTSVVSTADFTEHNQFYYDPNTGNVTLYMATFSEIATVSNMLNAWNGVYDTTWYNASATELTIANADQLAGFGSIVGGMAKDSEGNVVQDSFSGKTVTLLSDINLADDEENNDGEKIFYPIGYWNSEGTYEKTDTEISSGFYTFEGTFDGNGHTVANFYQNTWEMKGDHNWYDATLQYYRDGMGLFGKVYGGTVKNLTVENFSSDGEITTTGCVAAYADGATFENITIFNCNPRVYNIGNGGIVGCVGWYAKEANLKTTFTNITVDNSNKISALWGSYDVACGGIVGQYYPTSGQSSAEYPANAGIEFVNCHVAAQMDVYNDVCANYQYYAYRYAGMLIGSVRENETIDGHVYPKMDGITAEDCTVHFGTWNDYYYCEIIDNTTASYTHDYQMSRLVQVASVDGENMEVTSLDGDTTDIPTSGRYNYVVVNGDHGTNNATCYHFKDGEVWNHEDGGYHDGTDGGKIIDENGDGNPDLREDKQHLYLEFNNLVTGYGWGVTSKGVNDLDGVIILDREEGNSVTKFEGTVIKLANNKEYKLSDIFSFVDNGVKLVPGALTVTVTNLDENNPVSAEFERDTENWENGTLTLTGTGSVQITIQDYYFCTPTTITVTVTERQAEEKFDIVMNNGDFLHRVGNSGTVALDKLFKAKDGVSVGTVSVTIEAVDGTGASGTYSNNAIQFSGTGVVKVTITDNDYCTPAELYLEVVDAVNATTATSATANNVVLLNDCGFSSIDVKNGYALYGNGFTMTCGRDSYAADFGYAFVTLADGTLDNVQIVCPNFDYAALYKSNLTSTDNRSYTVESSGKTYYYNARSGVMVAGNSQILNSRISGARAAVNVSGGNVVIDNSRIELGAVASILVGAANSLTLRDVTLVQQPTASTYDSSKTLMGFSVLFVCDSNGDAAPVTLEGTLVQNAWVDESDSQYVPSAGRSIIETVLSNDSYTHDLDGDDTRESLNLGFAYMPESLTSAVNTTTITDNRTDKTTIPYDYAEVSILNGKTYVYSYKYAENESIPAEFTNTSAYVPNRYSDIITVTYSDTTAGLTTGKSYGTNGWIYELNVDLDAASGYALDFSKLSMSINGVTVKDYLVNGSAKPASPVTVTAGGTTYTLTATINDVEYTATYKVTGTETSKDSPQWSSDADGKALSSTMNATFADGLCVASSYGGTWHGAAPALEGVYVRYYSVSEKDYKIIHLADYTPATAGKQNGTNTTWTYSPDNGDFTLTITGGQVHSSNNVYAMPVVCGGKLYFVAASSKGLVNTGNSARSVPVTYAFKDNNGGTELTGSHTWSIAENKDAEYSYSDFCDGTLTKLESSSSDSECVTPDTLITLADGTQKRVDELTYADELLVWDFYNGEYTTTTPSAIYNHGDDIYTVTSLIFSDGTTVKMIGEHEFFDVEANSFVYINESNVADYIRHKFVQADGNSYTAVELVDYTYTEEYTGCYTVLTAVHYNCILEGMFSLTSDPSDKCETFFRIFEVGEGMKYDAEKMQADIDTYGLFVYEDLAEFVTYEEYVAFGGDYFKILVGKGLLTVEDIMLAVATYAPNH